VGENTPRPQINASKLRVGGEIVGAIFAIGTVLIFLTGIPILRVIFPVAAVLGCLVALVLRFIPHNNPGAPWLLSATEKNAEVPSQRQKTPGRSARLLTVPIASQV
jgi:sugar phosphate permease